MLFLQKYDRDKPISLYIHIPFCKYLCGYCSFYSTSYGSNKKEIHKKFFEKLINEVKIVRDYFNCDFKTIYIGGGTPNLPENLMSIGKILDIVGRANEISMEANSSFLTNEFLQFAEEKITRLSVGVQSFRKKVRNEILRFDDTALIYKNLLKKRRDNKKFPLINFDFITNSGNVESFIKYFDLFLKYCKNSKLDLPEHLSLYSLQIEDGTIYKSLVDKKVVTPPSQNSQAKQLLNEWKYLSKLGYEHYEISAFARNENFCQHNMSYWNGSDFIGLGPSAASRVYYTDGSGFDIKCNTSAEEYVGQSSNTIYEIQKLDKKQTLLEYIFTGLRTNKGLSISHVKDTYNIDVSQKIKNNLVFELKGDRLFIKEEKRIFSEYYISKAIDLFDI